MKALSTITIPISSFITRFFLIVYLQLRRRLMNQFAGWDLLQVAVNWEMAKVLWLEPEGQFVGLENI